MYEPVNLYSEFISNRLNENLMQNTTAELISIFVCLKDSKQKFKTVIHTHAGEILADIARR